MGHGVWRSNGNRSLDCRVVLSLGVLRRGRLTAALDPWQTPGPPPSASGYRGAPASALRLRSPVKTVENGSAVVNGEARYSSTK